MDLADAVAGLKRGQSPIGSLALEPGEAVSDLEFPRLLSRMCHLSSTLDAPARSSSVNRRKR